MAGNFYPQITVTVTKNLVTATVIWVKVTILHCAILLPEYGKFYQTFFFRAAKGRNYG